MTELEELCPKPHDFGEYNYASIDGDGRAFLSIAKPKPRDFFWSFHECAFIRNIKIPIGIYWQYCCWSKLDSIEIWGEKEK